MGRPYDCFCGWVRLPPAERNSDADQNVRLELGIEDVDRPGRRLHSVHTVEVCLDPDVQRELRCDRRSGSEADHAEEQLLVLILVPR